MKITDVGGVLHPLPWDASEATQAMLACDFTEATLAGAELLAAYDPQSGVISAILCSDVGVYAGDNSDGWNNANSFREFGGTTRKDIAAEYGEAAPDRPIWRAYLARVSGA